ncbi:hypothetical protein [Sphingomonas glacialis]|uniref:hypothetical protein n=1 Tax=Sphingomonas glacialis TaxID=658225 RepID=UPI00167B018D|nr:hypothetical protein [Sphingomonas glacialis]
MLPLIAWAREGGESPVLDKMVTGLFDAYPNICFATGAFGNTNIKTRSRQAFEDSVTAFKLLCLGLLGGMVMPNRTPGSCASDSMTFANHMTADAAYCCTLKAALRQSRRSRRSKRNRQRQK